MDEFVAFEPEGEIPSGPLAHELTEQLVVGVEHIEEASEGEKLLFEIAEQGMVFVVDRDLGEEKGNAAVDRDEGGPLGARIST